MKNRDEPERETRELRERIAKLSAACLRISSSLDISIVLREIVESVRALTGADYGMITTIGDLGQVQEFVSSGFTPEEHRQLQAWPVGPRLFEHLRDLPGPLRVSDFHEYSRSLGYSSHPLLPKIFQGTPMRFQGVQVGTFFLSRKEGGRDFTNQDEEILMLFASQAAVAIANARTHEAEKRARADREAVLGTLIYTCARVGAISRLRMQDLRDPGNRRALQFSEKGARPGRSRSIMISTRGS